MLATSIPDVLAESQRAYGEQLANCQTLREDMDDAIALLKGDLEQFASSVGDAGGHRAEAPEGHSVRDRVDDGASSDGSSNDSASNVALDETAASSQRRLDEMAGAIDANISSSVFSAVSELGRGLASALGGMVQAVLPTIAETAPPSLLKLLLPTVEERLWKIMDLCSLGDKWLEEDIQGANESLLQQLSTVQELTSCLRAEVSTFSDRIEVVQAARRTAGSFAGGLAAARSVYGAQGRDIDVLPLSYAKFDEIAAGAEVFERLEVLES
ncbi:unnamed protein product, partial [Prorocentrum cordatum]